jgi:hypothetical protein
MNLTGQVGQLSTGKWITINVLRLDLLKKRQSFHKSQVNVTELELLSTIYFWRKLPIKSQFYKRVILKKIVEKILSNIVYEVFEWFFLALSFYFFTHPQDSSFEKEFPKEFSSFGGMCRFPQKEISEISEISVTDNNSDRYTY